MVLFFYGIFTILLNNIMELLSGTCLNKFYEWLDNQDVAPYKVMFWNIPEIVRQAYLVSFFDNANLPIWAYQPNETGYWAHNLEGKAKYDSRPEALTFAIEEANEIFNSR